MKFTEFRAGLMLIRIGSKLNQMRNDALKQYDMTASLVDTIFFFDDNEGSTISNLKDHLQTSHQAAQKNVEKLKEKGYVYTTPSASDARANIVHLTDSGVAKCRELREGGELGSITLFQNFSKEEKETFIRLVDKLNHNM